MSSKEEVEKKEVEQLLEEVKEVVQDTNIEKKESDKHEDEAQENDSLLDAIDNAEKVESVVRAAEEINELKEKANNEINKVEDDVQEITDHTEKKIDEAMDELKGEAKEAHEETMEEVAEIKETVKDTVDEHSRVIAILLYLCGCFSMLWTRKNADKTSPTSEEKQPE